LLLFPDCICYFEAMTGIHMTASVRFSDQNLIKMSDSMQLCDKDVVFIK